MPDATALLQRARTMLVDLEWAGTVWTDYGCCPICGALYEGIAEPDDPKLGRGNKPKTHMAGCELVALVADALSLHHK